MPDSPVIPQNWPLLCDLNGELAAVIAWELGTTGAYSPLVVYLDHPTRGGQPMQQEPGASVRFYLKPPSH
jgi:hypothetical protein